MVTFLCYNCDKTLKKQQVEKHLQQCRRAAKFICIVIEDCKKTFLNDDHVGHTSCLSEKQLYWGPYANKKPGQIQKDEKPNTTSTEEVKVEEKKWPGWRKRIQKYLKEQGKQKIKLHKIQEQLVDEFVTVFPDFSREEAMSQFEEKVAQGSSFQIENVPYLSLKQ